MSKAKIYASMAVVFLLWLQPVSYCQNAAGAPSIAQVVVDADPIVDVYANLLIFKTVFSTATGLETEVTLISSEGQETKNSYSGMFSRIKRGEAAVYAIGKEPAASAGASDTPNLVALVTGPGSLPAAVVQQPLSGKIDIMKIARGTGADLIYLVHTTSAGRFVLIYTFNGTAFSPVGGPIPLS